MTKPSPGPWTVEAVWDSYGVYRVVEAERRLEALAAESFECDTPDAIGIGQEFADEENTANVRLIAAAPAA
jgi:hypothetical protein